MATVALAPHGEERMFPLNVATVIITLVGHLIFGLVLGLAFLKAPRGTGQKRLALATAVRISAGQAGHSVLEESHQFALKARRAAGRRDFSDDPRRHACGHEDLCWVKIGRIGGPHVFPPGSLEAVRTGADPTERPTSDPRQGLDQCGVARARRRPSPACTPSWRTTGLPGRYATSVVATARTSTEKRSTRNGSCVPETSCDSASAGWSTWRSGRPTNRLTKKRLFPTPPSSLRV